MKVMQDHVWHDNDIAEANSTHNDDIIEIVLKEFAAADAILLHKNDVIRLSKLFGLAVYDESSRLWGKGKGKR